MIKLTAPNGKTRYFAPELIVQVSDGVDETFVWIDHVERAFTVRETSQEVVRKIMLHHRYTEVHRVACGELEYEEEKGAFNMLLDLAGLEADSK